MNLLLLVLAFGLASADNKLTCDVTKEPGVKYFDIRLPTMNVPSELTTYVCQAQAIPLPMNVEYHAVAFEPLIANKDVMHHMILFACPQDRSEEPHTCRLSDGECRFFFVQWSMGIKSQICSYPNTGVRFGKNSFHSLALQIHWNNMNKTGGMSDSSGMRVYYTTRLRKYDVGNLQVGQNDLHIPPGVAGFAQTGSCSSACTRKLLSEPIYLTRAHIHLHYVGDGGILKLIRPGKMPLTVVNDPKFDYNNPPFHNFDDPVQVLPGDELQLTCFYNTRDGVKFRNRTIGWDLGSDGEMCYVFITYYPRIPGLIQCIQFGKQDICNPNEYEPGE